MGQVRAIVLRAAGINCDMETEYALRLCGAEARRVHVNRLIENKSLLDEYQILVVPGGFSYGDDVAAGRILANQMVHHLAEPLRKFVDDGKLVLGICNGFQVLVKTGLLPGGEFQNKVTLTDNDSGKFEDRWVHLEAMSGKCVFIGQGEKIYLPVAHAEGKVQVADNDVLEQLKSADQIAFRYVDSSGGQAEYPYNPNGSVEGISGLIDSTGRVMGLMPHPERYIRPTQHPHWSRLSKRSEGDGRKIFANAVEYVRKNLLTPSGK